MQVSGSIPLGGSTVCIELQQDQGVYKKPPETGLTSADLIELVLTLGIPLIFVGLAFWFIRYHFDQNAVERVEYKERDTANDRRAFELDERSNEAMRKLYEAVAQEYQGH